MLRPGIFRSAVAALLVAFAAFPASADEWLPVASGITRTISGIALAERSPDGALLFLVVHDSKNEREPRVGLVTWSQGRPATYKTLPWPEGAPVAIDLEALAAVPDRPGEFIALASAGTGYHLRRDGSQIALLGTFELPGKRPVHNFEGFALQKARGRLFAVWAHRGSSDLPGQLFFAPFDLSGYFFGDVASATLSVPWPEKDARTVSDLAVDPSGAVLITSASDPGDDGPFASALYVAGTLFWDGTLGRFTANATPTRLWHGQGHKVEALALVPGKDGGLALGSDDENFGGWLRVDFP